MISKESILEALTYVIEPDLHKNIVELNLVENLEITDDKISFELKVRNPALHNKKRIEDACIFNIRRLIGKELDIDINIKDIDSNTDNVELRKVLPGVKNIIAVASGKGGVGKSTVSTNIACGLSKLGFKTGLVDADIYGPSIPTMLDTVHDKPRMIKLNDKNYIEPIEKYGIKLMSMGYFADVNQAIVWRGSMATKAINQMIKDVYWGDLDYLIIDLPPGTGDIHLSIVQLLPLTGVVIVSTPQLVAMADVRKGINMFQMENINVPIIGLIENMSYFVPEDITDKKYYLFGKNGVRDLSNEYGIDFLGEIPIKQTIREASDAGRPAILQDNSLVSNEILEIIEKIVNNVDYRNDNFPPTKKVEIN